VNKIIRVIGIGVFGLGLVVNVNVYAMGSRHQSELAVNYDMNRLIGTQVRNSEGEMLGVINDFVADQEGRVIFAVLDHDSKFVAIPFSALSISEPNLRRRKLSSTPTRENWMEPRSSAGPGS